MGVGHPRRPHRVAPSRLGRGDTAGDASRVHPVMAQAPASEGGEGRPGAPARGTRAESSPVHLLVIRVSCQRFTVEDSVDLDIRSPHPRI